MAIKRVVKRNGGNLVITIGYAYNLFENEKAAKGLKPATMRNYKQSLGYLMDYAELTENTDITTIDRALIIEWINTMRANELSVDSIKHYLRDCRAFLYWCMHDDRKFIERFTIESVKGQEPKPKTYSQEDINKLKAKPKRKADSDFIEWRNWAIVNLIYDMGARCSTIINIQLQDVNLQKRSIYLRHTKNQSLTHATISTQCAKILKEFMNDWRADTEPTDYLFCNYSNEQLTYNALAHSFTAYCKDRGVIPHGLHGIRHTFATALAENTNGDMIKVQKALGHSSIEMARHYVNIAGVSMGNYDDISPLAKSKDNRGRPKRTIKKK